MHNSWPSSMVNLIPASYNRHLWFATPRYRKTPFSDAPSGLPDADQQNLLSPPVLCTRTVRQREPFIFCGAGGNDVEELRSSYERVSANKWNYSDKLNNLLLYLAAVPSLWFRNYEAVVLARPAFKRSIMEVFYPPAVRKPLAEQRLRTHAQDTGENFTRYIDDVLDLCRCVNAAMTES